MKFSSTFSSKASFNFQKNSFLISSAIKDLINKFYITQNLNFEIISYGNSSKNLNTILNGVLDLNKNQFPTMLKNVFDVDKWKHEVDQSLLILVKDFEEIVKFMEKVELGNFHPKKFVNLIFIENLKNIKKLKIFAKYRHIYNIDEHFLHFTYFLIDSGQELQLFTLEWFTKLKCDKFQIILQDSFDKKFKKWKNSLKIEEKFKNFHNCMIVMYADIFAHGRPNLHNEHSIDKFTGKMTGSVAEISKSVAQKGKN